MCEFSAYVKPSTKRETDKQNDMKHEMGKTLSLNVTVEDRRRKAPSMGQWDNNANSNIDIHWTYMYNEKNEIHLAFQADKYELQPK